MQVKQALGKMIQAKTRKGEVIHLKKVKWGGAVTMTIGSGNGSGTQHRYAIWRYTKECRCGEVAIATSDAFNVAEYLIELCGREFLKRELPLHLFLK